MDQVEVLETPIKSEGDKKEYHLIKLKNGLKALLIKTYTDENQTEESNAAASLTVAVGSFDEPKHIGGLAHFLEVKFNNFNLFKMHQNKFSSTWFLWVIKNIAVRVNSMIL